MTIPQIKGFLGAIIRSRAVEGASFVSNVAVAAQGDSKGIKKTVNNYLKVKNSK